MAVMVQMEFFLVVTPCSVVVGYQRFRGPCCLHLQGEVVSVGENGVDVGPDRTVAAGSAEGFIRQPVTPSSRNKVTENHFTDLICIRILC
jgi:hypothetical protein